MRDRGQFSIPGVGNEWLNGPMQAARDKFLHFADSHPSCYGSTQVTVNSGTNFFRDPPQFSRPGWACRDQGQRSGHEFRRPAMLCQWRAYNLRPQRYEDLDNRWTAPLDVLSKNRWQNLS